LTERKIPRTIRYKKGKIGQLARELNEYISSKSARMGKLMNWGFIWSTKILLPKIQIILSIGSMKRWY